MPALLGPKQQQSHARLLLHPKMQPQHRQPAPKAAAAAANPSAGAATAAREPAAAMTEGEGSQLPRSCSPDVQLQFEVEEPGDAGTTAYTTASVKKHTAVQLHNRTDITLTPGGTHRVASFARHHLNQLQQQLQQQAQQQQEEASSKMPLVPQILLLQHQQQQQQQQQQQLLDMLSPLLQRQVPVDLSQQQEQQQPSLGAAATTAPQQQQQQQHPLSQGPLGAATCTTPIPVAQATQLHI